MYRWCFTPFRILHAQTWASLCCVMLILCTWPGLLRAPYVSQYRVIQWMRKSASFEKNRRVLLWSLIGLVSVHFNANSKSLLAMRRGEYIYADIPEVVKALRNGEMTHVLSNSMFDELGFTVSRYNAYYRHKQLLSEAYQMHPPLIVKDELAIFDAFRNRSLNERRSIGKNRLLCMMTSNSALHLRKALPELSKYASFVRLNEPDRYLSFVVRKNFSRPLLNKINLAIMEMIQTGFLERYDRRLSRLEESRKTGLAEISSAPTAVLLEQLADVFVCLMGASMIAAAVLAAERLRSWHVLACYCCNNQLQPGLPVSIVTARQFLSKHQY